MWHDSLSMPPYAGITDPARVNEYTLFCRAVVSATLHLLENTTAIEHEAARAGHPSTLAALRALLPEAPVESAAVGATRPTVRPSAGLDDEAPGPRVGGY